MGDRRQPGGGKAPRRHSLRPRVARPDSWNAKCLISTSPPKLSPPASLSPPPSASIAVASGLSASSSSARSFPFPGRGSGHHAKQNDSSHSAWPLPCSLPSSSLLDKQSPLSAHLLLSPFVPPPERSVGSAHRSIGVRRPASQSEFSGGSHPVHHSLATSGQDRLCGPAAADRPKADAFETRQLQCTQRTRPTEL